MTGQGWPQRGRCGACARAATRFPSGRWEHDGRPCAARSQSLWHPSDVVDLRAMLVFVPDGEDLPQPVGWRMVMDPSPGLPEWVGYQPPEQQQSAWDRVRAELAARADQPEPADS